MCKNKYLEAHLGNRHVIALDDVKITDLPESKPNDCGVLCDYSCIVISDSKDSYYCIHVAKHHGRYYIGYGTMHGTGGASSPTSITKGKHSKNYATIAEGINDKLSSLLSLDSSTFSPFRNDFMRAISNLKQTPKPIQLTLNLF